MRIPLRSSPTASAVFRFLAILTTLLLTPPAMSQSTPEPATPPIAKIVPHKLEKHGHERIDNYYWLREREDQEVIDYLNAENDYLKAEMKPYQAGVDKIFEETKARIKQDDSSVPYEYQGYTYYTRYEEGKQYPIHCRKKAGQANEHPEEILINVNEIAEGHSFCRVSGIKVSTNSELLTFAVDFQGRRIFTQKFKRLTDGTMLPDEIENVTGNTVWANDNKTVFYTRQDPETLRWDRIYKHKLGGNAEQDSLVFKEEDEEFSCYVTKSRSKEFVFIGSEQTLSSDVRYLKASDPDGEFTVFENRAPDHEYDVDHYGDSFYIRTNWDAKNFRIMRCSSTPDASGKSRTGKEAWEVVIPHSDEIFNEGIDLFRNFATVEQRQNGLTEIVVVPMVNGSLALDQSHKLDFGEPTYSAGTSPTPDPETDWLRFGYTSMTTPSSVFQYNMATKKKKLLKENPVLGTFDKSNYKTDRLWATARDGVKVPISLVYHRDTKLDGTAPCLEYAYGSYGNSIDAGFSSARLNLLDRGFVYAIAHIRGGQEMGRHWYEDGKLLKKMNTFTDFIDCGKHLVANKIADPKRLYARGGSAGGLLMGAVINLDAALYHGIVADVPFVDVVTTMLDDTIPLTTSEYDEWGNPNVKEYYDYMLSYSPYDQTKASEYPNILVTTGLHDSQVQYWEPAKWVAKIRAVKKDNNLLLLKTNMEAGHGGASGRFDRFKEVAFRHAFLLRLAGIEP